MSPDRTFKRSSVTKMLVAELIRTTHALPKGEEQYEAQTYFSPAGRTVAKVMICGTAIEKEDVGKDSSLWRMRISDPSGTVQIYAGMYQAEAAAVIAQIEVPCFVAVVGKLNIYEPEPGSHIVSIRPDSVTIIDGDGRDNFILDASLCLIRSVRKTDDETMQKVISIYGEKDNKETYILVARQAIESLLQEKQVKAPDPAQPQASPSSLPDKVQEALLQILDEKRIVKREDIPNLLKQKGVTATTGDIESAVKNLMREGFCFEPKTGTLRIT